MRYLKRMTSDFWGNQSRRDLVFTIDLYSKTIRLVMGALLGAVAVIFQSAGIFTGLGYLLSMMTTGPIVLASLLSTRIGLMTYFVTIILLAVVQPSELVVFPFTTGLLGLSLGFGLKYLRKTIYILPFSACCLTAGISILLYVIGFPILGPSVTSQFNLMVIFSTFTFSILYSWIWMRVSVFVFNMIHKAIIRRTPK
jgi:hypothetical protein